MPGPGRRSGIGIYTQIGDPGVAGLNAYGARHIPPAQPATFTNGVPAGTVSTVCAATAGDAGARSPSSGLSL